MISGLFGSLRCISDIYNCDETLGYCFTPRMEAVGGPIRKFLSSFECFISQASECVQVRKFTPHHKTTPTYMIEADMGVQLAMSFCEFSCEKMRL